MPNAFLTSNKQDYATPWPLIDAIESEIDRPFTLDVCASEKSAKAPKFYTKEDNGLQKDWAEDAREEFPHAAWCNPEYGDGNIPKWLFRANYYSKVFALTTVFLLPANKTDQVWWHEIVIPNHTVWDVRGRVSFLDPETGEVPVIFKDGRWVKQSNPQASKIVIVGPGFGPCLPRSFIWR